MYSFNNFFSGIYFLIHIGRLCLLFVTSWNSVVKWEMYVLLLDANFIFPINAEKSEISTKDEIETRQAKNVQG